MSASVRDAALPAAAAAREGVKKAATAAGKKESQVRMRSHVRLFTTSASVAGEIATHDQWLLDVMATVIPVAT